MIIKKPVPISFLFFGVLIPLVAESHSFISQQQVTKNDCMATEVEVSLLINQAVLLRLLNESSTSYSFYEMKLREIRELLNDLQAFKTTTLKEMQNMTTTINDDKMELREIRELLNDLQAFKTTTMKEMQNMTAIINAVKESNEETRKILIEVKEAVVNLSHEVAIITTPLSMECEKTWREYQSSCYKVFKTRVTYDQATANCRAHGSYLASIGSAGENSFVHGLIEGYTYIGLDDMYQEGIFIWQDGSPFTYSKWYSGEPNNEGGSEDCTLMYTNSYWNDETCGSKFQYVCEKRLQ